MAKIKVLKDDQLVNGKGTEQVYPVSHSDAIYTKQLSRKNPSKNKNLSEYIEEKDSQIETTNNNLATLKTAHEKLSDDFNTLLRTGDVDGYINTFEELKKFLDNVSDKDTLLGMLQAEREETNKQILDIDNTLSVTLNQTTGQLIASMNDVTTTLDTTNSRLNPETGDIELVFNF